MRKLLLILVAFAAVVVFAGCGAQVDPATNVTSSSATINGHGTCDTGQTCTGQALYRAQGSTTWLKAPATPRSYAAGSSTDSVTVTGLAASTTYQAVVGVTQGTSSTVYYGSDGQSNSDISQVTPVTFTTQPAALAIHVSANKLIDQNGQPVRLIGVNRSDLSCATGNTVLLGNLSTDPAAIRSWHANAVRIGLTEDCWLGINGMGVSASTYQSTIRNYVTALHNAGLYVILTLHHTAPGSYKSEAIQVLADASHATQFWQSVASTFAGDPAVLFDTVNEPHPFTSNTTCSNAWGAWRDGCTFTQVTPCAGCATISGSWSGLGEQALINAIRGTGAKQPVIVECRSWPNNCSSVLQYLPSDPQGQIVVSPHMYPTSGNPCATSACWDTVLAPIAQQHPLLFGEFGTYDCSTSFTGAVMSWADSHHAGYLAWRWAPYGCGDPSLLASYDGTPNAYGQTIYNHFHSVSFAG